MDDKQKTTLDMLAQLVKEKTEVTLDEMAKILSTDKKVTLDLARILARNDIIEICYTIAGDIIFKRGKMMNSVDAKQGEHIKSTFAEQEVKEENKTDRIVNLLRQRILEKKYGKTQ